MKMGWAMAHPIFIFNIMKLASEEPIRILVINDSSRLSTIQVLDSSWIVIFKNGDRYQVLGPSLIHFGGLAGSPSPGKYYEKVIAGKFKYERIEA